MKIRFFLISIVLCAMPLRAQVHITADDPETWTVQTLAQYVGQTVIFDNPIVVSSNVSYDLTVGPWRTFQLESQGIKDSRGYNTAARINGNCVFTLTGVNEYHRCGEKVYNLTAKVNSASNLTFISGDWRGNKREDLEKGIPDLGDYRLLVCGFNLENYFMTTGSMGAKTISDRQKQRTKVSKALQKINADIYGLVELQKGDDAISEIVSDLNKNLPGRNYRFFSGDNTGTFQKVDFVYDANKVEPIGTPIGSDVEVQNRKKLICFREKATGEKFIYSINHFKAMNTGGETRRINESKAVLDIYKSYRLNSSIRDNDILIMGDLNCYAFTSPILHFTENGMIDLHRAFHADSSYSYIYGGMTSYIDHALCNSTLYGQITGMAAYHINSDENDRYTYDKSSDNTMFRCSDHDPVLVGLKLDSTLMYDPSPQINAAAVLSGYAENVIISNAYDPDAKSFYAIYTINGWLIDRQEITSQYFEVELPKNSGAYIVYVYYNGQAYQRRMIVR